MYATPPKTRFKPSRIARDTYLIHDHQGEGVGPVSVALNSLVIRGAEPVIVDTGVAENRQTFLADVFGLVDPQDVRWVFISHDDIDHTGNLNVLLEQCPNATLVLSWFMTERMGESLTVPPSRWRWVADGETFDVGDRVLHAVRPPVFDAPTTRGLFDPVTGVYWASDGFATPMETPVRDVAALDKQLWVDGIVTFDNYVAAWLPLVDGRVFQRTVDRIEDLAPTTIVGCHTPAIGLPNVATAINATRRSPGAAVPPQPDQSVLDDIQRTLAADAA
jgi:flavorubredoxin